MDFTFYIFLGPSDHKPTELLPIRGETFEQQVDSLIQNVFIPSGFQVMRWTRVPYLCEGDLRQSYYWLDDAVFLIQSVE